MQKFADRIFVILNKKRSKFWNGTNEFIFQNKFNLIQHQKSKNKIFIPLIPLKIICKCFLNFSKAYFQKKRFRILFNFRFLLHVCIFIYFFTSMSLKIRVAFLSGKKLFFFSVYLSVECLAINFCFRHI